MICGLKDAVFRQSVSYFVFRNDDFLFQYFDGKQVASAFFSTQNHLTKGSFAEHFDKFEIF